MSPIKHNKIYFLFFCKFFKNSIFSKFSILNVDKNESILTNISNMRISKKIFKFDLNAFCTYQP